MAAVANQFIIRDIDPSSPDFLYSSNIFDVAIRNGFYNVQRDGPKLDFLKTYAPKRAHSPYVTRYLQVVYHSKFTPFIHESESRAILAVKTFVYELFPRSIARRKLALCVFSEMDRVDVKTNSTADLMSVPSNHCQTLHSPSPLFRYIYHFNLIYSS